MWREFPRDPNETMQDRVELAAAAGRNSGVCPIDLLDDLFTNHWDIEEVCSWFEGTVCTWPDETMDGCWLKRIYEMMSQAPLGEDRDDGDVSDDDIPF